MHFMSKPKKRQHNKNKQTPVIILGVVKGLQIIIRMTHAEKQNNLSVKRVIIHSAHSFFILVQ